MIANFETELLNELSRLIGHFERFHLENTLPEEFDLRDLFADSEQAFFHIRGLARFWEAAANGGTAVNFGQYMSDLIIACHNQHSNDVTMIMLNTPRQTSLYLSLGKEQETKTLLEGMFPGILLEPANTRELISTLTTRCPVKGVVTGIPSGKSFGGNNNEAGAHLLPGGGAASSNQTQLERVIRGMHGSTWMYIVQAHPRPRQRVVEDRLKTIDLLSQVNNRLRVQWSSSRQGSEQKTTSESGSTSQTFSGDKTNYRAQYLIRLLERDLERLDQAMAAGQWTVKTYFGASSLSEARRLSSLLIGTLAGADSRPEPFRTKLCQPGGASLRDFHTFLNSHEVGTLIRLPREEVHGYAIYDYVRFDVDFRAPNSMTLPLGYIQQNGRDTTETFNISIDALTKHAVVIGVTGSGKTTTVMNLLDRVIEAKKPFLVIEPAKTEYRGLHSALAQRKELRVYTLGNEMVAPFRLNPFEFETSDEPGGVSLLSHIDFLKTVFNAAFALYAPMPQVLEMALHEIYEDKGWDLTSGVNTRLADWSQRHKYPIFPTLTDLYYKVEFVTERLGYHHEIESNVKAALKSRIGSLRIGSKGLMLDTARGIPMETLLGTPTILELENIGNDDEKTFLMGLFLAKLYEYRRLQVATGALPSGFQHLLVFEEAHRLLKNTSTEVSDEGSNPRAQAIEVFTNMLSEVRAYGQGVLVAEQIPSKLAPDVLKNTNLKIVHRLIAKDDRHSIGQTMNLSEEQENHLGVLEPGMAAIYAEGADHAYLVRLENYKRKITPLIDKALKVLGRTYSSVKDYQTIMDMSTYAIPLAPTGGPDPALYQAAGKILEARKSRWLWANILLRLLTDPTYVFNALNRFSELIELEMSHFPPEMHSAIIHMVIVRGGSELLQLRGAQFGWNYEHIEELRFYFTQGLNRLLTIYTQAYHAQNSTAHNQEEDFLADLKNAIGFLEQFINRYKMLMHRPQGPFAGCIHCPAKCLYRPEVRLLLSAKNREWIQDELSNNKHQSEEARYSAVARIVTIIVNSWVSEEPSEPQDPNIPAVAYCAALHTVANPQFTEYEQAMLANHLKGHFFPAPNNQAVDDLSDEDEDEDEDDYEYEDEDEAE